jgi:hypothetical protein
MGGCEDGKGIDEYQMCFTYEEGKRDECCGASGRKLRETCVYCPNYQRYWDRKEKQKREEEKNETDN